MPTDADPYSDAPWTHEDSLFRTPRAWFLRLVHRKVIGAIDGSHIKIDAPDEENLASYYNYKKVGLSFRRCVPGVLPCDIGIPPANLNFVAYSLLCSYIAREKVLQHHLAGGRGQQGTVPLGERRMPGFVRGQQGAAKFRAT